MDTDFSEIHEELRTVARDLLGAAGAGSGVDWALLAESGWAGLEARPDLDGAGATFAEVAVILEEMGRAATASPYLGSVVLGVGALVLLEPSPGRDDLIRDVASGAVIAALAVAGDDDVGGPGELPFRLERSTGGFRVHGQAAFVPDAAEATDAPAAGAGSRRRAGDRRRRPARPPGSSSPASRCSTPLAVSGS